MTTTLTYQYGGTLDPDRHYYVQRKADERLLELCRRGEFAHIFNARQTGKSSLLERTRRELERDGVSTVLVDLQRLGSVSDADIWYRNVAHMITGELKLRMPLETWWAVQATLTPTYRWMTFFEEVVLIETTGPLVIFIDEIDRTIHLPFRDDFFGALRLMYNERVRRPELRRLTFVLAGMATPQELIGDAGRTSYNIGEPVELGDLTEKGTEVKVLAEGLGMQTSKKGQRVLTWILNWTGGHPYLTQKLCALVVEQHWVNCRAKDINRLVKNEFLSGEKEDSNLNEVERGLTEQREALSPRVEVLREFERVLNRRSRDMNTVPQVELKLTGVVKVENGQLQVRNHIYRKVFDKKWLRRYYRPSLRARWRTFSRLKKIWYVLLSAFILIIFCITIVYFVPQLRDAIVETAEALINILQR